jgi:hypothetical protein
MGYLVGNEVQANTQFEQAHRSVDLTRHRTDVVLGDLASVRRDLQVVSGRVDRTTAALASDTTQLRGVQATLARTQANVSRQGMAIDDLESCLGGVEQALNALSVGDQGRAIAALNVVSKSCQSAVAANG